jgi:hypothetical protein
MLNRYGDEALAESAKRAEELAADGDLGGVAVWLRVIEAIRQLAITTALGPVPKSLPQKSRSSILDCKSLVSDPTPAVQR